jgi:hypothetical protein
MGLPTSSMRVSSDLSPICPHSNVLKPSDWTERPRVQDH